MRLLRCSVVWLPRSVCLSAGRWALVLRCGAVLLRKTLRHLAIRASPPAAGDAPCGEVPRAHAHARGPQKPRSDPMWVKRWQSSKCLKLSQEPLPARDLGGCTYPYKTDRKRLLACMLHAGARTACALHAVVCTLVCPPHRYLLVMKRALSPSAQRRGALTRFRTEPALAVQAPERAYTPL